MLFNYVNKKLHSCFTSEPLINADGTKCVDDSKKSNILNDFLLLSLQMIMETCLHYQKKL